MSESGVPAEETAPYGKSDVKRVRTHHLQQWKAEGHKWVMLTTYDQYSAEVFDQATRGCCGHGVSSGQPGSPQTRAGISAGGRRPATARSPACATSRNSP